ncbi:MAG: ClpXP protease specificity-enhancing factor [Gammaproteobacteria bacterium]
MMQPKKPYLVRAFYDWIVNSDCTPYIVVDTTIPYVEVPPEFIHNDQIVFNIAPLAVRHFVIENNCVRFNGRFSGKIRHVYFPMKAVMAIYAKENGKGMMFDEKTDEHSHPMLEPTPPSEMTVRPTTVTNAPTSLSSAKTKKKTRPSHLKLVDD